MQGTTFFRLHGGTLVHNCAIYYLTFGLSLACPRLSDSGEGARKWQEGLVLGKEGGRSGEPVDCEPSSAPCCRAVTQSGTRDLMICKEETQRSRHDVDVVVVALVYLA